MTKAIVGVIGGSGVYHLPGLTGLREETVVDAMGRAVRRAALRPDRRHRGGVPRPARPRASVLPVDDQLPRQHRRAEAGGRHRHHRPLRLRVVPSRTLPWRLRADRSVRRPDLSAVTRPSSEPAASPMSRWRIRSPRSCAGACTRRPRPRGCRAGTAAPTSAWRGRSSRRFAESLGYQARGADVIGMTGATEAKLAREAEISYATVAMVTDYDCWHEEHEAVDVAAVVKVMSDNADKAARARRPRAARLSRRARAVPDRLRPRARIRHHHPSGGARSGAGDKARRGRRPRARPRLKRLARASASNLNARRRRPPRRRRAVWGLHAQDLGRAVSVREPLSADAALSCACGQPAGSAVQVGHACLFAVSPSSGL